MKVCKNMENVNACISMWQTRDLDVTDLDMIVSKDTKNHKPHNYNL